MFTNWWHKWIVLKTILKFTSTLTNLIVSDSSSVHHQEFFTVNTAMLYVIQVCCQQTVCIAVCTVKNSRWWTEKLSETCRVLFQKYNWDISASSWFYYKNMCVCLEYIYMFVCVCVCVCACVRTRTYNYELQHCTERLFQLIFYSYSLFAVSCFCLNGHRHVPKIKNTSRKIIFRNIEI